MSENTAKIMKVTNVKVHFGFSDPPKLMIAAHGQVPTLGWRNGRLIPHIYINPPKDGIWDFDFVAEYPTGIVPQVVSPILSDLFVSTVPPWYEGIRVHSTTNALQPNRAEETGVKLTKFDGGHDMFPWAKNGGVGTLPFSKEGGDCFPWAANSPEEGEKVAVVVSSIESDSN